MRVIGRLLLLQLGWSTATESEAKNKVSSVLAHRSDIHACYGEAVSADKKESGELLVRLTVGPDQKVTRAEVLKDEMGSPALRSCLERRMLAWNMPEI